MISNSDLTIQTYRENFDKYVARTGTEPRGEFKELLDSFSSYLPEIGSIFEIGSASGRDARYLASSNFKVTCSDVIPQALQQLSEQGFETAEYDFRDDPKPEWIGSFDGVFANACLLHAPQDVFENALKNVTLMLKSCGVFAFSLKTGEGEEITTEKMDAPRYFNYHSEPEIRGILAGLTFEILSLSHAEEGKWLHVIARNSTN
jgi:SAM-dependent methyltransferase